MSPSIVGVIVFACTLGGSLAGFWLRARLPERHLDDASRDTVKVGIGLVATMTALVLGLVTASAKSSFDAADTAVKHTAMDLLTLDRLLARYGPETAGIVRPCSRRQRVAPKRSGRKAQPSPPSWIRRRGWREWRDWRTRSAA
jgi:hypothetical protein